MRLGALLGPVAPGARADALARQAEQYEALGYDSVWSAHAVGRGFMVTDPLIALAAAASATNRVELGTAILQIPLDEPAPLAHRVLSVAQLAGDRLRLGVGVGSTAADFDVAAHDYAGRFTRFDETIATLRAFLEQGAVGGVDLTPWPDVARPPIFYGSWGKGVERAASEFDGWIASAHYRTPDEVCAALERYRRAGGERAIVSTIMLGPDRSRDDVTSLLAQFAAAGFDDAVVMCLPGGLEPAAVRELVA